MEYKREFFQRVKKTIMTRPVQRQDTDILGQKGIAWATQATIYGTNWYIDRAQNLIEIYNAGAGICFKDILPKKDKYAKEGLYLQLTLAYRTTANANTNIRSFSGNHLTLPNSLEGNLFTDPFTYYYVTEDMTININSIYSSEKLWIQRVDWEWVSKDIVYEDELGEKDIFLTRSKKDIEALHAKKEITEDTVKEFLLKLIKNDNHFAKRCLTLLNSDRLLEKDTVSLFKDLDIKEGKG